MGNWVWLISSIGSLGALGAAVAAWKSAKATQRTASAQILMNITDAYSSPEMLSGMIKLSNWVKEKDFAKIFADKRANNYDEIKELDEARRRFSHHFYKIWLLRNAGLINTAFVKKVVSPEQADFLLKIIEPMEKAMNPNYGTATFDFFRKVYQEEEEGVMSKNVKRGLVSLLGGLGLIALLLGRLTDIYSFGYGLIFAVAFWIASVALGTMLGVKGKTKK